MWLFTKIIGSLLIILLVLILLFSGSPNVNIAISDHFDGERFYNLGESYKDKRFKDFMKWRFNSERKSWPNWVDIKQQNIQYKNVDEGKLSVTFINHATTLIQMDGINILTDPVYSKRVSPFSFIGPKRFKLPGIKFEDIPKIDIVLISHNHYDHFDLKTLYKLIDRDNPKILFGIGNAYYLKNKKNNNIIEMDWKDNYNYKKLNIIFLPAQHWSKRKLFDNNKALWGSFAIIGSHKVYFAGDTGYSSHFTEIAKEFGYFDLSLIPIGAYEPRWFMKYAHVNPEEALKAHIDLKSKKSIAIHFGTFRLTNESIDDPINDLIDAKKKFLLDEDEFIVLKQGEAISIN